MFKPSKLKKQTGRKLKIVCMCKNMPLIYTCVYFHWLPTSTSNFILPSNVGHWTSYTLVVLHREYLTIIPRARMGSESIAIDSGGHEGERNNCFSKIQLVGQKYRE